MTTYYRVVLGPNPINVGAMFPVGTRPTGFWTPHRECAEAIVTEHLDHAFRTAGGGLWPDELEVLQAKEEDLVLNDQFALTKKNGHNDRFDKDEVFAVEVREYKRTPWEEFLSGR